MRKVYLVEYLVSWIDQPFWKFDIILFSKKAAIKEVRLHNAGGWRSRYSTHDGKGNVHYEYFEPAE